MSRPSGSNDSIIKATQSTDEFSGHGDASGAAGVIENPVQNAQDLLDKSGESQIFSPPEGGFKNFHVGLAWNNIIVEKTGGFLGLMKKAMKKGVDLDLGCFYELQDGTRGVLQPFGELFGNLNRPPYIALSGDERTGDAQGDDEYFTINGFKWPQIKRILVYSYIYQGATDWSQIKPDLTIDLKMSDVEPLHVQPALKTSKMTVCALAMIKNVKDGVQISTHGEYFTSQAAMDRAFGFGLQWEDGAKN